MKKIILPVIGSLVMGSLLSGGTIYAIQTINHNKEIRKLRMDLQKQERECRILEQTLNQRLAEAEKRNKEIKEKAEQLLGKIGDNYNKAKEVYTKAVTLTTYTITTNRVIENSERERVREEESREESVTYYLTYFDKTEKIIKANSQQTTSLSPNQEQIPSNWDDLVKKTYKDLIESEEKFNNESPVGQVKIVKEIVDQILKQIKTGGDNLVKFFQKQLDALKQLREDIKTIDDEKFVELLIKIDPSIAKENWEDKDITKTFQRLNKIKELLKLVEDDWTVLSTAVRSGLTKFEKINKDSKDILDLLISMTDAKKPASETEDGRGDSDPSREGSEDTVS
ncbi:hypothetical protein [Mycoplasma yeatsii]|uniref:Uncharacterized protein YdhG (YjbR/CyaY superfamily) n=1 Tax=Mycoplasma yeatsii TaxID=51365 RepID=A0ABU0NDD5_9MOLU|nr:hypothetical protein [Mycoplasma yeatsii]MDQ0567460.1 uncharacterized protein YdhG (YjbR/CyaY superfamily) [Mycoplasma yeatsii]